MKSRIPKIFLLYTAIVFSTSGAAFAELVFEETRLELKAKPEEEELPAVYKFTNKGKGAVKVARVESSCGCLKAESNKSVYEPGESGTINAIFKLSKFTGQQEKSITVVTNDKTNPRQKLRVAVDIPKVVEISPQLLEWKVGEEPKTKSFRFKVPHTDPVKILRVKPSRDTFTYEMKVHEEGRDYEILLTPASTDAPMLGVLRIETDCAIEKHKRQMAFFSITKPRPSPAATTETTKK